MNLNRIIKSRPIILEMIKSRGYNIDKYSNYSIKEIEVMINSMPSKISIELSPLDMTFNKDDSNLIVKYITNAKVRASNISSLIYEMVDEKLTPNDTLVLLVNDNVSSDSLTETINNFQQKQKKFIQIFNIESLMFNITQHILVPHHEIMNRTETANIMSKYNIQNTLQLPLILQSDPVAKFIGARRGDIVKITKPSETAGEYVNYRLCH